MSALTRAALAALLAGSALAACDGAQPPTAQKPAPAKAAQPTVAPAPSTAPAPGARWPFSSETESVTTPSGFDPTTMIRRNYYVVFDASGSMSESKCSGDESKLTVAKRALIEFVRKLPADVNVGLMAFDNSGIRELVALGPLQRDALTQAITPVRAGGNTPLAGSIRRAYTALSEQGRRQLGYGEFHLVVITDGEASDEDPRGVVNTILAGSPVVFHTIGFCIGKEHSLNQAGKVVYRAADNPAELASGLADVLAESPTFDVQRFK